jgi:hypothetical protein
MEGSNVSVLPTARCQLRLGKAIRPVLVLADTADLIHSSAAKRSGEAGANRWISSDPVDVENWANLVVAR